MKKLDYVLAEIESLKDELSATKQYAELLERYGYNKTYINNEFICWNKNGKQNCVNGYFHLFGKPEKIYEDDVTSQYLIDKRLLIVIDKERAQYTVTQYVLPQGENKTSEL